MQCPRCLNTDPYYFYHGSRGWYCRRCISFGRAMLEEETESVSLNPVSEGSEEYVLRYPLTPEQKSVSDQCAHLIERTDVLLHCVCGAGKTELVVQSISNMLRNRKKVCFAIPRRQVVLELRERLSRYFPHAEVTAVCGGHTQKTDGDLIICTTHGVCVFRGQTMNTYICLILRYFTDITRIISSIRLAVKGPLQTAFMFLRRWISFIAIQFMQKILMF